MKKLITIILISLSTCFMCPQLAIGQGSVATLSVTQLYNFPSLPDTIYEGVSYDSIRVVVTNTGSVPYQGSVSIGMQADSVVTAAYINFSPAGVFMLPGDSIVFNINNYVFDPNALRQGGNIVVVWPVANANTGSTIVRNVYFVKLSTTGIAEPENNIRFYPNPTSGPLVVITDLRDPVERVRIWNAQGQQVITVNITPPQIDLSGLKPGIYFIELHYNNEAVRRGRVVVY